MEWLSQTLGEMPARIVIWAAIILAALIAVLFVIRLLRGLMPGVFVAGGSARRARLAVVDAAAVDSRRRLVLVRRDSTEHLLLVGGPTDLVVERDVAPVSDEDHEAQAVPVAEPRAPVTAKEPVQRSRPERAPQPRPEARRAPAVSTEANTAPALRPVTDQPAAVSPAAHPATPRPQAVSPSRPQRPPTSQPGSPAPPRAVEKPSPPPLSGVPAKPAVEPSIDDNDKLEAELRKQLNEALLPIEPEVQPGNAAPGDNRQTLENEMSRLLKDLAEEKKPE